VKKYLRGRAQTVRHQVFRYGVGGNIATVLDFLILVFLTDFLHIHYIISATIAFICGVIVSYIFNIRWVFYKRKYSKKRHELTIFFFISVVGLLLTNSFLFMFTEYGELFYMHSKILASLIVSIWNFTARKYFLFNH